MSMKPKPLHPHLTSWKAMEVASTGLCARRILQMDQLLYSIRKFWKHLIFLLHQEFLLFLSSVV